MNRNNIITVDEMTAAVKEAVLREPSLQNLSVRGELLGFKLHTSGHAYFTLLGHDSRVSCVLFKSYAASVLTWPKDGDEVLVRGKIDVYGARGSYQIYAVSLLPLGIGAKARAKEALRLRLEKEGLFDTRLKRALPRYPSKVAVITSPTGAALQDVLKLHALRFPCAELIVIPSLMQGLEAAEEISLAFEMARRIEDLSCVMLVRGGGNRDDLDVFDDESVVRAVRLSPVPVITGLGHQIDSTLSDLAADAAAPTPSGAAERLFPDGRALDAVLSGSADRMRATLESKLSFAAHNILTLKRDIDSALNTRLILPYSDYIAKAKENLDSAVMRRLRGEEERLAAYAMRLESLSPLALLSRGYSICTMEGGETIRSVRTLVKGSRIRIRFSDGCAGAVIKDTAAEKDF